MSRPRFTVVDLRKKVDEYNVNLIKAGIRIQFFVQGRNGYQAVDEYDTDKDGKHISSGCQTVGCGTSREVYTYCLERYYQLINKQIGL